MNDDDYIKIRQAIIALASAKKTLRELKVIRSERLTGEIGEFLAGIQLGGEVIQADSTSNKGWDLMWRGPNMDKHERIQVKCHAKGPGNKARWTIVKHVDDFERLIVLVLSHDYHLKEIYNIPTAEVKSRSDLITDGKEYRVMWDKFKDYLQEPSEELKNILQIYEDSNTELILDDFINDDQWEILTRWNANTIYFAPTSWIEWNIEDDNLLPRLKKRKLIFELFKRTYDWKISLVGASGYFDIPETIPNNAASETCCYRLWEGNEGDIPLLTCDSDGRPDFVSKDDFLRWINEWIEMTNEKSQETHSENFEDWVANVNKWAEDKF